ncbi:MAG: SpoIIE family protein phosphatase [candidate division KSB1 bacterium]|nr:SpoIIE family protein phosphatase [candidate division KSB1 bacterium]
MPLFVAALKEIGEANALRTHYLFENGATIGRHEDNDITLPDDSLSRFHARIEYCQGKFFIYDLGSRNGVFVNESKTRRRELKDFDRITLGKTFFLFRTARVAERRKGETFPAEDHFWATMQGITQRGTEIALSHQALEVAVEFAIKLTQAERGIIFLYDKHRKLQPAVFHNLAQDDLNRDEFEVSRSAIAEAENRCEMVLREGCLDDPRYQANESIHTLQLNTIICLPLKSLHAFNISRKQETAGGKKFVEGLLFGVLYLDSRRALKGLPQHRRAMLQVLADQTALAIENVILQDKMLERDQLKKQLLVAKDVQRRLFPQPVYTHARFDMALYYAAAQQIGGDYLAFLPLSQSRFLLAVGDVVGKGLPAGLVMMAIHGGMYSEINHHAELLTLVGHLDRLIYEYTQGKVFVSFWAGVLDIEQMQLDYTNAGHPPALLYNPRRLGNQWLELTIAGIPLGVEPSRPRTLKSISLHSGDLITLYTDGVTEARDHAKKQFGVKGLKKVLSCWRLSEPLNPSPLSELLETVVARLRHFTGYQPLDDDTSLMVTAIK